MELWYFTVFTFHLNINLNVRVSICEIFMRFELLQEYIHIIKIINVKKLRYVYLYEFRKNKVGKAKIFERPFNIKY